LQAWVEKLGNDYHQERIVAENSLVTINKDFKEGVGG